MKKSGFANLPLHGGRVPPWLAERMKKMGRAITEAIVLEYGREAFLSRLTDPAWFQSFGAVMGMDWHSSGITTSVLGALKGGLNPISAELGIYVCGGRGKHSRKTPEELLKIADKTGLDGDALVKASKLSAKVDNTAIQDGYQLYLHSFFLTREGEWVVIQQGMDPEIKMARRYHWHSREVKSFVEEPHTSIFGPNKGMILNLTAAEARKSRDGIMAISKENPSLIIPEIKKIFMPSHHDVRVKDVDLKRLGSILALANEMPPADFSDLLLINGLGPRTLQSLTLVSEVIHGTPSRFRDPARFSFAHGGKDGHPFPVPTKVYDKSIAIIEQAVKKAKIGNGEKNEALKRLHQSAMEIEKTFDPDPSKFKDYIQKERDDSWSYGGRTVMGPAKKPDKHRQLKLF